ncbi:LicD family domain containing protein [Naviculisporaceae sp. PSN 640]
MRLSCLLPGAFWFSLATSAAVVRSIDMSGLTGGPPEKYFHEAGFNPHYDGRFAQVELGYQEQKQALRNLVESFLSTFRDIGVETWLAHGSLLGWWWNKRILPWDSDIDVQVTESGIWFFAAYYNMSVFYYQTPRNPEGRKYMLEVNPHFDNRDQTDTMNKIDARWIDMKSGLFIDITAARYNLSHPGGEGMMSCKDGHEFHDTAIFPLRETTFEGVAAKIPYKYQQLLVEEYGKQALTRTHFNRHVFKEDTREWIPDPRYMFKPWGDRREEKMMVALVTGQDNQQKAMHHPTGNVTRP